MTYCDGQLFGKALRTEKHFSSSCIVVQTELNHEKSDCVPSTVTRIVTVITAVGLKLVLIYRILERTVPCLLRLFYFCFIRTDLYCSWSVVSQSVLLRMRQLVMEK